MKTKDLRENGGCMRGASQSRRTQRTIITTAGHKKGLREEWLTTLEASKTDIAALAVVGGLSKRPNKRTLLALGALVWIVGINCDLDHATEGEGLLLCA
jgi:hypothetical protein